MDKAHNFFHILILFLNLLNLVYKKKEIINELHALPKTINLNILNYLNSLNIF
jgi:hypothetical protein